MGWTNVAPGSPGTYPDLLLEWAPTSQPTDASQAWEDITDLLRGWEWGYGRNDELGQFEAGSGFVQLDNRSRIFDPSFTGEDTTNLCTNGGFETDTSGWVAGTGATLTRVTTVARSGLACGKVVTVGAAAGTEGIGFTAAARIAETTGQTVTATAYVRGNSGGEHVRIQLNEYNSSGTFLRATTGANVTALANGWTRLSVTATLGTSTAKVAPMIATWTAAAYTFFVDDVQVETGATAHRYVETDGATRSRDHANIKPRRMFRLRARWASTIYPVFVAYARGFPQTWPAGVDNTVRVNLADGFAVLQSYDLGVGFTRTMERSDVRIAAVLDAIGIPTALQDLDDGTVDVAAINVTATGTSGLTHAKTVAQECEFAPFFQARDGKLTFHNRHKRLNASSLHTFTDSKTPAAGELPYLPDLEAVWDDTYLANHVIVNAADSDDPAGDKSDSTSADDHYPIVKTVPSQLADIADRQWLAEYQIARYKDTAWRTAGLPLNGAMKPADLWPVILNMEISDRETIKRFADADDPLELVVNVEGIKHSCKPGGPWTTSVATSPADTRTYWKLADATYGEIGDPAILIAP